MKFWGVTTLFRRVHIRSNHPVAGSVVHVTPRTEHLHAVFSGIVLIGLTVVSTLSCAYITRSQETHTFNVKDYGAEGDSRVSNQGRISAGSKTLSCSDCAFTSADVGKKVYVYGASAARHALSLGSNIQAVTSSTTAVLANVATNTTKNALVQIVGHDDTRSIVAASRAACRAATSSAPAVLTFPAGGVYTLIGEVIEPCSNLRITGPGTILQAKVSEDRAAGQGTSVIVFPRSRKGRVCQGGTMDAGSEVLRYGKQGNQPCNFNPADVGSTAVVVFAGENYLPLYARIKEYISDTEVILDQAAGTSVPVTTFGLGKVGTVVEIGVSPITNVEIDHLTLMNVTTAYPPDRALGIGIVALGADALSVKRWVRVHDLTVITASINCLGGINGVLDDYSFQRNTLIGCADAAIYVSGYSSRGEISNNTIDNIEFPGVPPEVIGRVLQMGILVKDTSNVSFVHNTIRINTGEAGIMFGDFPQFFDQVYGNTITVSSKSNAVLGIGGNTGEHLLLLGNNIECQAARGKGIWFYSQAVKDLEAVRNVIRNCTAAIKFDSTGGDLGPADLELVENSIHGCRDGIRLEEVGGINKIFGNDLKGCAGAGVPWLVTGSQNGSVTYFTADNATDNSASPRWDESVHQLPRAIPRPQ